ncbi:IclR family transcriptional regulator [Actinocorallia sp. API 0066]|uniref:IclR family transcriptional regulator n=1 Tax=Actinocorallia sp. API 0066 TaxID=2896846 RepID=UPI001E4B82BC|nr:IclR family transcriptional regulator [Actinocorallia sp. API 0066]MCD0451632.1 IclR family transcriptional regulator [Actinocorallia sp. API 0066]
MTRAEGGRQTGAQTVERAFDVLNHFRTVPGTAGISEIARRLDLNVSAVYRIVRAMEQAGFLEQDPATRRYRLGSAVAGLNRVLSHQRGFHLARPELRWLSREAGGSAALALRDGDEALVVGEVSAESGGAEWDDVAANSVPLHTSAFGKVLLAWPGPEEADLAALAPLVRRTERSITDLADLRAEIDRTRERGWALADREMTPTQLTVAAPVRDPEGRAALAVGVGLTYTPENAARVEALAPLVTGTAERLSTVLT